MQNAQEIITELENHRGRHGKYPDAVEGEWPDYQTGIAGIEKYQYARDGDTYNLFFEQPRFFFDQFGTREFVAYNPADSHLLVAHASVHIFSDPQQVRRSQGWYTSFPAGVDHWKVFWFD